MIPDGEHTWLASTLKVKFDLITQSIKERLLAVVARDLLDEHAWDPAE